MEVSFFCNYMYMYLCVFVYLYVCMRVCKGRERREEEESNGEEDSCKS